VLNQLAQHGIRLGGDVGEAVRSSLTNIKAKAERLLTDG
jgi:hypothetical protein